MTANIASFSYTIFVVISVSWQVLGFCNFKISIRISSLCIFEKEKGSLRFLLQTFPIASRLGWFLYFTIHFKTGSLILLAKGLQFEYPSIFRLLTILKKKVFKSSAVLSSSIIISSSSINVVFKVDVILSDKKGLMVFQNVLLSLVFSPKYAVFNFLISVRNNCVVLNTSFCFLHFYPSKNCFEVSLLSLFCQTEHCS